MFYLTTYSTHFYLLFCGVRHNIMVKDHSDSERGRLLLPLQGLLFPICSTIAQTVQYIAFVAPVMEHWLEQENSLKGPVWKDRSDDPFVVLRDKTCNDSHRNEENVLFNDTLNAFYLWLYGVGHMVNYYSDSERGNLLLPHGLLFPINSKIPQTG